MNRPKIRIYQPSKTAQQSGRRKTKRWVVEFEPSGRKSADGLIGWVGSDDTNQQVKLTFKTKDDAIAYCRKRQLEFVLTNPQIRHVRPKSYAENFTKPMIG